MAERVVVAMSGGVDSSVAAALLAESGYDVIGLAMRLWDAPEGSEPSGCCSLDDFLDAHRVADRLRIPFYVMDFRDTFEKAVVSDFVAEYRRGRTPNPCARCNQFVKFATFFQRARELGADLIATGHYARVRPGTDGPELLRGVDEAKDQSYFLFSIDHAVLRHTMFPVGALPKTKVREEAQRRGLPVARKPDSQEVCFVARGAYAEFVERYASSEPIHQGQILDMGGRVLGRHGGVHRYTIGQRRRLGLNVDGSPRYVAEIDPQRGVVRVGSRRDAESWGVSAVDANWLGPQPRIGDRVTVKIRSRFRPTPAVVTAVGAKSFCVEAEEPLQAVTPGQAAVLYDGDRVIGGGWIDQPVRRPTSQTSACAVAATTEGAAHGSFS